MNSDREKGTDFVSATNPATLSDPHRGEEEATELKQSPLRSAARAREAGDKRAADE